MINKLVNVLKPFSDLRIISVFFLGILSGLPWLMIGSALTLWLKEADISRTSIGYAGLIFGVYAINFLWSPLIDNFKSNKLRHLGPRRLWVLAMQFIIVATCCVMPFFEPQSEATTIVGLALVIAIASATQDMAIDAFRVDAFHQSEKEKISAAAGCATAGWWTGFAGLGLIPLALSDRGFSWPELYPIMGLMSAITALGLFIGKAPESKDTQSYESRKNQYLQRVKSLSNAKKVQLLLLISSPLYIAGWVLKGSPGAPEALVSSPLYVLAAVLSALILLLCSLVILAKARPSTTQQSSHSLESTSSLDTIPTRLLTNVIAPIEEFFLRNGVKIGLTILGFIVVFKLGESFLGRMSILFYKEVGYTNTEIGAYSKLVTWGITAAAAIPFAVINAKLGLVRGLFVAGVCMAASNLLFVVIAMKGPDLDWLLITVVVDGITQAWSSIAFVAFISALCSQNFSATQYALMASLGTLGRSTLAAFGGQLVDALDGNWALFFIITTLMVIPGLVLLLAIRHQLSAAFAQNTS